jgi:hypothetical protein
LTTGLALAGVAALGAVTMFFFDPARGRRRRALCMEQLTGAANAVKDAVGSTARDLTNRARGTLAEARSALTSGPARESETAQSEMAAA